MNLQSDKTIEIANQECLVSVVVPAHNVEPWLHVCLKSISCQSFTNLEIIVIDDGSTDKTYDVIMEFSSMDPRVIPLRQSNKGLSATRNEGVARATGDILIFVDADDWIAPETVSEVASVFESENSDIVIFKAVKFFENDDLWKQGTDSFYWRKIKSRQNTLSPSEGIAEYFSLYPLAQLKAVRRSFWTLHDLSFREKMHYEDNLLHSQLFALNPKIFFLAQDLYVWRQERKGQITSTPHTNCCLQVLEEIGKALCPLKGDLQVFQLIAAVKLLSKVCSQIDSEAERKEVLDDAYSILAKQPGLEVTRFARDFLTNNVERFHPADFILGFGFLKSEKQFSILVSPTSSSIFKGLTILNLVFSIKPKRLCLSVFQYLSKNARLVRNFKNGVGEGVTRPIPIATGDCPGAD